MVVDSGIGADQQRQFSARGRIRQAGDRAIEIDQAARVQLTGQMQRVLIGDRRAFDRQRPRLHGGGRAVLAEPDRARGRIVGDHGHHGVGVDRGILR